MAIAEVIACLHHHGIVHGDIKPENILFGTRVGLDLRSWLIDFGLAHRTEETPALRDAGMITGTLGFIDPYTIATGKSQTESDVFSFGATLYEWYAREQFIDPATTPMLHGKAYDIFLTDRMALLAGLKERHAGLEDLIKDMLALDCTRRPTMAGIVGRLRQCTC